MASMGAVNRLFAPFKEPKKKFIVMVSSEIEEIEQDEDGEDFTIMEAVTLQFEVEEQDMKVFQRVLNANGYLYTVQPMDGENYAETY